MQKYDVIVLGAGIVGAATARELKIQFPSLSVCVVEKEPEPALHQTGRNSGVIHAGVYYQPGSLKAKFCQQGLIETVSFCQNKGIEFEQCGKLIVATNSIEQERLHGLFKRCQQNGLSPQQISKQQLRQMSPNTLGDEAIFIKQTGIVDYKQVTAGLLSDFVAFGGKVKFNFTMKHVEQGTNDVQLVSNGEKLTANFVINCTGVMSDHVAKRFDLDLDFKIIPFKGEYFVLPKKYDNLVEHLIYPVPDPSLPFLGIHLTKMIDGSVTVGPNAVLAGAKEGYGKFDLSVTDLFESLGFVGFWRMLSQHKRSVWSEFSNSLFKSGYLSQVQKYCPKISLDDLLPYRSGIRAQAVEKDGSLIHDFKFARSEFSFHVCNAPSPAATSAMPIAKEIVNNVKSELKIL